MRFIGPRQRLRLVLTGFRVRTRHGERAGRNQRDPRMAAVTAPDQSRRAAASAVSIVGYRNRYPAASSPAGTTFALAMRSSSAS